MSRFRDLLFNRDRLPRSAPTNGSGGYGPQVVSPAELAELRELRELRARRDELAAAEQATEKRLLFLRGQLDDVQNDLLARARSPDERSRIQSVIAAVAAYLPRIAGPDQCTDAFVPGVVKALVYPPQQQSPSAPENLRSRVGPPQPAIRQVERAIPDAEALASSIVAAGRLASGDERQRPILRGPEQPRRGATTDDEALAAAIVKHGRKNS
jgi:hypothetical protein